MKLFIKLFLVLIIATTFSCSGDDDNPITQSPNNTLSIKYNSQLLTFGGITAQKSTENGLAHLKIIGYKKFPGSEQSQYEIILDLVKDIPGDHGYSFDTIQLNVTTEVNGNFTTTIFTNGIGSGGASNTVQTFLTNVVSGDFDCGLISADMQYGTISNGLFYIEL
ncbi:MAG: hypothetical protein PSV16_13620 [Flavobacterium sp.]|nr:hypothetical protein [Flavobacterium sp.]